MKEPYEQGLASHSAPTPTLETVTSRVWHGQGVHAGQPLSSEISTFRVPTLSNGGEGNTDAKAMRMVSCGVTRRSRRPCACVETPDARTGRPQ